MSNKKHAKFSPSASERWLNCPACIKMQEGMPSTTSAEALEGQQAHELASRALQNRLSRRIAPGAKGWALDIGKVPSNYNSEMVGHVADFIEWLVPVLSSCKEWFSEKEVTLLPDKVFGTADVVGISEKRVVVVDFKYGKNVYVPAFNNPQIGIYGLAAAWSLGVANDYDFTIEGHIYQPRFSAFNEPERFDMGPEQITALMNAVKIAVYRAENELSVPNAGDWCQWCKAVGKCNAHLRTLEVVSGASGELRDVATLTVDELAFIHSRKSQIKKFLEATDARIIELASSGVEVPGTKVVESTGHRKWKSPQGMMIFEELRQDSVLSPAQAEKKLGKAKYAEKYSEFLAPSVVRPAVASPNSKNKKYDFAENAFAGFIDESTNNED